jgi:phage tail sheath gpL-like
VELTAPGRIAVAVEGVAGADGVVELSIGGAAAEPVEAGESLLSVRSAELPAGRHELRVAVSSGSAAIRTLDVRLA